MATQIKNYLINPEQRDAIHKLPRGTPLTDRIMCYWLVNKLDTDCNSKKKMINKKRTSPTSYASLTITC